MGTCCSGSSVENESRRAEKGKGNRTIQTSKVSEKSDPHPNRASDAVAVLS
jgi:hypothetical protein